MFDTSARHGPPPTASLQSLEQSVKLGTHQPPVLRTSTTTEQGEPPPTVVGGGAPDLSLVLVLAVVAAIAVRAFWRALLGLAVITGLALVFTGILIPVMMMAPPR